MTAATRPVRPSSMCDRGDHGICRASQALCNCRCHGRNGQTPPEPGGALVGSAKAQRRQFVDAHDSDLDHLRTKEKAMPPALKAVDSTPPRPSVGLERCEPPIPRRGQRGLRDQIRALVPELIAEPDQWFRVARWPGKSSASGMAKIMRDLEPGIEWRSAVVDGGSALWGRASS